MSNYKKGQKVAHGMLTAGEEKDHLQPCWTLLIMKVKAIRKLMTTKSVATKDIKPGIVHLII